MEHIDLTTDDSRDELYGVYVGVVTDIEDPKDMARVKLTFPWRDAKDKSTWAQMATEMGGDEAGSYFVPEEDEKVLVAFGDGDIHDPYVLGSLWSGTQAPPVKEDQNNDTRLIKSQAGHELTFDDTKGKGGISIETKGGRQVVLDENNDSIELRDGNGNTVRMSENGIEIDSEGTISLSGQSLELDADDGLDLSAKQLTATGASKTSISSNGRLSLKATGQALLQANGNLQVKSTGVTQVRGTLVMLN